MTTTQMTWRPPDRIRAKAIAIAKREGRLLVCEVLDDRGVLKGWVPPGGGVEFGEPAEVALRREIKEELGVESTVSGAPTIYENIFEHEGATGHEIVFVFPVSFGALGITAERRFQYRESDGARHFAEWIDIDRFRNGTEKLFPAPVLSFLVET